jgi:hypothetical protein
MGAGSSSPPSFGLLLLAFFACAYLCHPAPYREDMGVRSGASGSAWCRRCFNVRDRLFFVMPGAVAAVRLGRIERRQRRIVPVIYGCLPSSTCSASGCCSVSGWWSASRRCRLHSSFWVSVCSTCFAVSLFWEHDGRHAYSSEDVPIASVLGLIAACWQHRCAVAARCSTQEAMVGNDSGTPPTCCWYRPAFPGRRACRDAGAARDASWHRAQGASEPLVAGWTCWQARSMYGGSPYLFRIRALGAGGQPDSAPLFYFEQARIIGRGLCTVAADRVQLVCPHGRLPSTHWTNLGPKVLLDGPVSASAWASALAAAALPVSGYHTSLLGSGCRAGSGGPRRRDDRRACGHVPHRHPALRVLFTVCVPDRGQVLRRRIFIGHLVVVSRR